MILNRSIPQCIKERIRNNLVTTSRPRSHALRKCSDFGPMFNGLNWVRICSLALCQLAIVESRTVWLMDCCAVHDCFYLIVFSSSLTRNAPIASTGVEHLQCLQPRHWWHWVFVFFLHVPNSFRCGGQQVVAICWERNEGPYTHICHLRLLHAGSVNTLSAVKQWLHFDGRS